MVSAIFAGCGLGALFAVVPLTLALHRFGGRCLFSSLLLISACVTALMPLAAFYNPILMVPARIVQGLTMATVLPMTGYLSARWAPIAEIGEDH
jgi:MFS family permease